MVGWGPVERAGGGDGRDLMLVSPAEPALYRQLGKVSSLPEQYGSDFLIFSPVFGRVGVQRKAVLDLVASETDGRVRRELMDMKGLDVGIWLIEGRMEWTTDGLLVGSRSPYSWARHTGTIFSIQSQGFWMLSTSTPAESTKLLCALEKWLKKSKHQGLMGRPGARGNWGEPTLEEQRIHFLQGVNGVGYERAKAAVKHFGGLPLQLTGDLGQVPGWGKGTVKRVEELLGGS